MLKTFVISADDPDFRTRNKIPGATWLCPWYHDPERDGCTNYPYFLSQHYRKDWADKRPPIAVVCPNGSTWVIDQKSSNGTGWVVTGEHNCLTVSPSIDIKGHAGQKDYHGYLRDGVFTPDLEGRTYELNNRETIRNEDH